MAISALGVPNTDFVYTNPASAQQAADSLRSRLAYDNDKQRAWNDYLARTGETRAATQRAQMQSQTARDLQQAQLDAATKEGAAGRTSAEKIAGMGEEARVKYAARQKYARDADAYNTATRIAEAQNANPSLKVPPGYTIKGADGRFSPLMPRPIDPDAPIPPPGSGGVPAAPGAAQPAVPPPSYSGPRPYAHEGGVFLGPPGPAGHEDFVRPEIGYGIPVPPEEFAVPYPGEVGTSDPRGVPRGLSFPGMTTITSPPPVYFGPPAQVPRGTLRVNPPQLPPNDEPPAPLRGPWNYPNGPVQDEAPAPMIGVPYY